ncbi:hypothetical protein SLEP1_g47034 [Rubroshorea leprosula]|uniref:Uncharacterized protein n=1 Tax=Rubroshorea leprosula TaxID=152421 RepID=A0AAV5LQZ7_9ROSI|nr:hypothetical protein SLEP1_g47034 [Rubroshorea leprosula]
MAEATPLLPKVLENQMPESELENQGAGINIIDEVVCGETVCLYDFSEGEVLPISGF